MVSTELSVRFSPELLISSLNISFLEIKTPQLIGIFVGCTVFTITILTVFYLLYASGSFSKLMLELQGQSIMEPSSSLLTWKSFHDTTEIEVTLISPQYVHIPELYDNLLAARKINSIPIITKSLVGSVIEVGQFNPDDCLECLKACDGSAQYHESDYNPLRIWGWLDLEQYYIDSHVNQQQESDALSTIHKNTSTITGKQLIKQLFTNLYLKSNSEIEKHLVIIDNILRKPIGMMSLIKNCRKDLSIQLDNIWITPAFQGTKRVHDAIHQVVGWLINLGYRRVAVELDERNIIGRRLLDRCGFQFEAILRKHKIIQNRNRNTALYTIINSDWEEVDLKLKKYLGIDLKPKMVKAADFQEFPNFKLSNSQNISKNNGEKSKRKSKTSKRKK
eukprot:gene11999-16063_t